MHLMTLHIFLLPFHMGKVFPFSFLRMLHAKGILDAFYQIEVFPWFGKVLTNVC